MKKTPIFQAPSQSTLGSLSAIVFVFVFVLRHRFRFRPSFSSFVFVFLTASAVCACGKMDGNGDLGGNWQLDADTYFSIHANMAQWRQISHPGTIYMSYFRQEGDSLFLTLHDGRRGMYRNDGSNDEPVTHAAQMPTALPVPPNFAYRIRKVGSDSLVLTVEGRTLRMRRY